MKKKLIWTIIFMWFIAGLWLAAYLWSEYFNAFNWWTLPAGITYLIIFLLGLTLLTTIENNTENKQSAQIIGNRIILKGQDERIKDNAETLKKIMYSENKKTGE